ncbi:MAG: hypothetical protein HRU17_13880 [Polyangiaceae bacterium]|nr:hypothetical protein [Polyangiaceae bacterium]
MRFAWAICAVFLSVVLAVPTTVLAQPTDNAGGAAAAPERDEGSSPAQPAESAEGAPAGDAESTGGDAAPAAKAQPKALAVDGSTYAVRMRDLEARVDELKEKIRRSHSRLSLLSDTILSGGVGGSAADITFRNEMSRAFRLTRALFVLDGAVQYNKRDESGGLSEQAEIPIFSGSIPPGDHTLQVLVQLRGHGYGVFSYLRGYRFEVKSTHSFTVTEGKTIKLEAIAWEKGGVTTPLEQRPDVRYTEKISSGATGGPAPKSGGKSSKGASGSLSIGSGGK